jgi:glycosyltransferase involved in cell wall biosynthesis
VSDGDNGLLIEPRNVDQLEAALMRLLGDDSFRLKAGARSRAIAVERFGVERFVGSTLALYKQALDQQAPAY